jgi:hypothetical protein
MLKRALQSVLGILKSAGVSGVLPLFVNPDGDLTKTSKFFLLTYII